ncbi:MAG: hypothetical protein RLZZ04_888 [Cyanobacteriota bacterium]|jgi:hypothetical protein
MDKLRFCYSSVSESDKRGIEERKANYRGINLTFTALFNRSKCMIIRDELCSDRLQTPDDGKNC